MDTKYKLVRDYIIEAIKVGKFKEGEKIYSENMLARKFKVSRHTVRRAIMELVYDGILYSSKGKGTFVSSDSSKKDKYIAVLTTYISDYIFPSIIRGVEKVVTKEGFGLVLLSTDNCYENEKYHLEGITENDRILGLIVEPTKSAQKSPNEELYNRIQKKDIPVVFINTVLDNVSKNYIITDDSTAEYNLTQKLIEYRHKKLLGVFKKDDLQGIKRYLGFKKACLQYNIPYDVIWFDTEEYSTVHLKIADYVRKGNFDCIMCYNDKIALPLCTLLKEKGYKIPSDISVAGFDNSFLSTLTDIKLTTINHPKEKLGEYAAKVMVNMINGRLNQVKEEIRCDIIFRNSTRNQ